MGTTALTLSKPRNEQDPPVNLALLTISRQPASLGVHSSRQRQKGRDRSENRALCPARHHKHSPWEGAGQETHGPRSYSCAALHARSAQAYKGLQKRDFSKCSSLPQNRDPAQPHSGIALSVSNCTEAKPSQRSSTGRGRGTDPNMPVAKARISHGIPERHSCSALTIQHKRWGRCWAGTGHRSGFVLLLRQAIENTLKMAHVRCLNFLGRVALHPAIPLVQSCTKPWQMDRPLPGAACHPLFPWHLHSFGRGEGTLRCVYEKPVQRVSLTQPEPRTRQQLPLLLFLFNRQAQLPGLQHQPGTQALAQL